MNKKGNKHYVKSNADRLRIKNAYLTRHKKDLDTKDFTRAGFLSYYLLWNKSTIGSAIIDYKKRFKL